MTSDVGGWSGGSLTCDARSAWSTGCARSDLAWAACPPCPPCPPVRPLLLELDLTEVPVTPDPDDPLDRLRNRGRRQLRPTLRALYEAGEDSRVVGLVCKVGGALPWATMQELRLGVEAFARSGKPTVAWAESFDPGQGNLAAYALASAFGEIWLQPGGGIGPLGVGRGDDLPARGAGQAGHRAAVRAAARVQERRRPDPTHRADPGAPRVAGAADRLDPRRRPAADRGGPVDRPGPAADADGRQPVHRHRGARRRAGRPARLPGRGVRLGPVAVPDHAGAAVRRPVEAGPSALLAEAPAWSRGAGRGARGDRLRPVPARRRRAAGRQRHGERPAPGGARERLGPRRGAAGGLARRLGGRVGGDLARGGPTPRRRRSRWWSRWATWPPRAATTSPARPT